jgi:hypothetical protein
MTEIEWAILCDYAFLDVGRKTCLIGTFDRIFTPLVPAHHHQAAIVIKFTGTPGEVVKFKIEVLRPLEAGGTSLAALNAETKLGDAGTSEFSANLAGLPLPDYGVYSFNIYVGNAPPKTITFSVVRPPGQPTTTSPPPQQD